MQQGLGSGLSVGPRLHVHERADLSRVRFNGSVIAGCHMPWSRRGTHSTSNRLVILHTEVKRRHRDKWAKSNTTMSYVLTLE